MAQPITSELTALLTSKLQAGASGFRGKVEIDWVYPGYTDLGVFQDLALAIGTATGYTNGLGPAAPDNPTNVNDGNDFTASTSSNGLAFGDPAHPATSHRGWVITLTSACPVSYIDFKNASGLHEPDTIEYSTDGGTTWTAAAYTTSVPGAGFVRFTLTGGPTTAATWRITDTETFYYTGALGTSYFEAFTSYTIKVWGTAPEVVPPEIRTATIGPASISLDRSRGIQAAQLDALFPNESGGKGYYTEPNAVFVPNNPIRAYATYGDPTTTHWVQVFAGLMDRVHEARDPKTVEITARSRMKWLLEQDFIAIGSQSVSDTSAIRTEANGVYVGKSPEYIVGDILDRAGWPSADRVLGTTGVTVDEYDLADGSSWADQIAGSNRLTTVAGFDFWEDEVGVVHFDVSPLTATSEPDADYTFQVGIDVMHLDHETDDVDRYTRVRVSGPMTSAVPSWNEDWATTVVLHPNGSMYRPSEVTHLYVVDGVTKYLYELDQATRTILAKWDLSASLSYAPIGLSVDPTDSTTFYVLDADWRYGATTHAKVRKFTFSTKALAATTTLPDGQWSDMKFDGTHLWLTNYGDDKLYEKTFVGGGTAGATADFSYSGHTNPTGMYLDGTTIGLFFNNGTAFYLVDTSAPGTITGTQSTAGTHIEGGEIDTTTHTDLYALAAAGDFGNTAGYVWKFQLATLVTADVVKWAYDQALEDALGFQSGIANRVHDLHSGDAAHPFEIRPYEYAMNVVNSEAQAQAVADAQLVLLERLRRQMDLATLGEPQMQINDVIRYVDPVAGIDAKWIVDTYRGAMDASGSYTSTFSVLPWSASAPVGSPTGGGGSAGRGTPTYFDDFATLASTLGANSDGSSTGGWLHHFTLAGASPAVENTWDISNASVTSSILRLRASGGVGSWVSAEIDTKTTFTQLYGYFEARMKAPKGQGLWAAFWLYAEDTGWYNEIDVTEVYGNAVGAGPGTHEIDYDHRTVHWIGGGSASPAGTPLHTVDLSLDYHVYAVDWRASYIKFYLDDSLIATFTDIGHIPTHALPLILDLAVGGGPTGGSDGTTPDPSDLLVDYVRVYA